MSYNVNYVNQLASIVPAFVNLNYSIVRVFDLYQEYRNYALARPDLYQELIVASVNRQPMSTTATQYREIVFNFNYRIHVELIGGEDSTDEFCLYKSFRKARAVLKEFETSFKPESSPWWFWVFHPLAMVFAVAGLVLVILRLAS